MTKKIIKNFGDKLYYSIRNKESFLCLGLDPHLTLIPNIFQTKYKVNKVIYSKENLDIVENFCFSIIENCINLVPAIKLQIAFFEQLGPEGIKLFSNLCHKIKISDTLCIIDAKRSDISSTATAYSNAYLDDLSPFPCDALTVNPWLGIDSIMPFIEKCNKDKGIFVLLHTSNFGSFDIQKKTLINQNKCYEDLAINLKKIIEDNLGFSGLSSIGIVAGGTFKEEALNLRKILPSAPFLIPGFGHQGARIDNVVCALVKEKTQKNVYNFGIVNSSRGLCFPNEANNCTSIHNWVEVIRKNIINTSNKLKKIK